MTYDRIIKRQGRNRSRNKQPLPIEQKDWRGVNYVDDIYTMPPQQLPFAQNVDLGAPIGAISKVAGYESLFTSLGAGKILGLHTWEHSVGDKLIAAWDKYLYLLSGASGSIAKTSQADWDAGTKTNLDTATTPGTVQMAKAGTNFSEVDTLTADFNGTHSSTRAISDSVQLVPNAGARFYIQTALAPYNPATENGAWDDSASTNNRKLSKTKSGGAGSDGRVETSATNDWDALVMKVVTDGLPANKSISGTLAWCLGVLESNADANMYYHVHAFVTAGDSDVVRGTLLNNYIGAVEWPTTAAGLAVGAQAVTTVAALAGDRIVIEIGYRASNTSTTSYTGSVWLGGTSATDLTDGGDETLYPGWFEFSNDPTAATYTLSGTYTHTVQNVSSAVIANAATVTFNKTEPANTAITMEVAVSTDGGSNWGAWAAKNSGDTIIAAGTDISNYRVKWRANLTSTDGVSTPSLNDVTVAVTTGYLPEGTWISPAYDMISTPLTATLAWTKTAPAGTALAWYAAGSSNGTVFGDWQLVATTGDAIPTLRYVKIKFVLTGTASATATVTDLLVSYSNSYSQANRLDISPLGRTSNLLTGNRVRMQDHNNMCYCADGLRPFVLYVDGTTAVTGTAQAVTGNTMTLAAGASAVNSFYNNAFATITGGSYIGKTGFISGYVGATKIATFTTPGNIPVFDGNYTFARASVAYKQDGSSVASGVPRYETGTYGQAIMIEEGTTNLLLYSEQFANAAWATSGTIVVTDNTTVAPNGLTTAATLAGASAGAYRYQHVTGYNPASKTITFSVWLKAATPCTCYLVLGSWAGGSYPSSALSITATWQRFSFTATYGAGDTGDLVPWITVGTNTVNVWGAHVELKDYSTSYMQTTSTAVARAAETLTTPNAGVFTKGNWAVDLIFTPKDKQDVTYNMLWVNYIDGSNFYAIAIDTTGHIYARTNTNGTPTTITDTNVVVLGSAYYITFSGDGSNLRLCVNGTQIGTDTAYTEPVGALPTNMNIGFYTGTSYPANGLIDDLRISNRARTLAEHQTAYTSGQPLTYDSVTTFKASFDDPANTTYSIGSAVKARKAGVDPPGTAPTLADSTVAGTPNGVYYGKITFINADGYESNPSSASASLTVASKKITWTVPVNASAGNTTAKRKLYRTKAGGSVYYYVDIISDNTTTAYTDNIADTSLTILMEDNNNIPPNASIVYMFMEYMFYANGSDLWFSKVGTPEQVPNITGDIQVNTLPSTILDIKSNPMALIPQGENFIAPITTNTGFIFDSDPTVDTTIMRLIDKNGSLSFEASDICIDPQLRSILVFPTNTGIRTLLPGLQDGSIESTPMSRNIQDYFDRTVNRTNMAGIFFNSYYLISVEHHNPDTATNEYLTFAYDFRTSEWYGPWTFGCSCYIISAGVLYAGDTAVGKIYRMFTGSSAAGANLKMIADLPMISPGGENRTYKFNKFMLMLSADSDTSVTTVKPKVDSREATVTLGTLTDTFTGVVRLGHNNLRSKKYKIPLARGNTLSYRIEDDSTHPISIQKVITECEVLPLKK